MNLDWKLAGVFGAVLCVMVITLGFLTFKGLISGQVITALVTGILGWLAKSPLSYSKGV